MKNLKTTKNQPGFTLVELIVVVTIFGIIMGAILNIIRPANESYSSAEAIVETNQTGSAMIDYLDENLKYATNMLVLKDYVGVPKVNNGMLGGSSTIYKSCIIIDNNNLRGYSEKDYSGDDNDTAQKRMGCTGCIIRIDNINTDGLSFDNSQVALGVDEYGKFKFDISAQINGSAEDKKWNLDVSLDTYEPVYDGGTYSFTKTRYKAESSIDLVNINVKPEDPFRVNDFVDFSVAPDYTKYPQENLADATGYSTEQQKVYYDTANSDNKYTYIFFDKKTSADSVKYSVTFQYAADSPVNPGSIIASTMVVPGNKISGIPTLTAQAGYLAPVWKCDDGNVYTADEIKNYVVNNDVTFFAYYQPDSNYNPHTVTLYEMDGTTVFKTLSVQEGTIMPYPGPPSNVPENYKFLDWVLKSDNSKSYKDVPITAEGYEFVPLCEELLQIQYLNTDNTVFLIQYVKYEDFGTGLIVDFNVTDTIPDVPSDKIFVGWQLQGDTTRLYPPGTECTPTSQPVVFVPALEDKPAEPTPPAGDSIIVYSDVPEVLNKVSDSGHYYFYSNFSNFSMKVEIEFEDGSRVTLADPYNSTACVDITEYVGHKMRFIFTVYNLPHYDCSLTAYIISQTWQSSDTNCFQLSNNITFKNTDYGKVIDALN